MNINCITFGTLSLILKVINECKQIHLNKFGLNFMDLIILNWHNTQYC